MQTGMFKCFNKLIQRLFLYDHPSRRPHEMQGNLPIIRKVFNLIGVAKLYVHIHNYSSTLYSHRKLWQSEVKLSSRKKENFKKVTTVTHVCGFHYIQAYISPLQRRTSHSKTTASLQQTVYQLIPAFCDFVIWGNCTNI